VRRCLNLALGDGPMFDADSLTGKPVRPDAGLEVLTDDVEGMAVDVLIKINSNGTRVSAHWFAGVLQSLCSSS
jgi:hypothetical protein